ISYSSQTTKLTPKQSTSPSEHQKQVLERLIRVSRLFECAVISGLLHFLFLSALCGCSLKLCCSTSCVRTISRSAPKKREVLSTGFLCVIGYVLPLAVVCVSCGRWLPEGYGSEAVR
ncbi:hypothetical protein cypCar_00049222, partial [Cyprinus carpio]